MKVEEVGNEGEFKGFSKEMLQKFLKKLTVKIIDATSEKFEIFAEIKFSLKNPVILFR